MILMDIYGKKIDFKPIPKPIPSESEGAQSGVRINKKQPQ
jgi:hypothetical protein